MNMNPSLTLDQDLITREQAGRIYRFAMIVFFAMVALTFLMLSTSVSLADTGSDVFGDIKKLLEDYLKGTLGVVFALLILLVGVARSIMTSNLFYLIIALGTCIVLYYAPSVFESLMDSVLYVEDVHGVDLSAFRPVD